jgi:hypothetical protein
MIGLLCVFLFLHNVRLKLAKTWKKEFEKKYGNGHFGSMYIMGLQRDVVCQLTDSALVYESKCGEKEGGGRLRGLSQ